MSASLPLSYWPARRRKPGPLSSTKVRRVSGNRRSDDLHLFKRDGCSFNGLPPVAALSAETAAVTDCFVEMRIDGRYRQQAAATLVKPCCSSPVHKNAGGPRWALACVKGRRDPVRALHAVAHGLQAVMGVIRPMVAVWWLRGALLLLMQSTPANAAVDLTLYGGAFDSSSIIAHAEV